MQAGKSLSDTAAYGTNPYFEYDSRQYPSKRFYQVSANHRLAPMQRVIGIELDSRWWPFRFQV